MNITRTIKVRLILNNTNESLLLNNMLTQYADACNFVSQYVFDNGFELNSNKLSNKLYHDVRTNFNLKSQLASSVFKTVTARYKTLDTVLSKKPYRIFDGVKTLYIKRDLNWLQKPIMFKRPQADLVRNRDYSFVDDLTQLSLQTLGKRIKVKYSMHGFEQYLDDTWKFGTGKLLRSGQKWFLHIAVTKSVTESDMHQDVKHVVGLDRGLRFLATSYDERGKTTFFDGKKILRKRAYYNKRRTELQALGTKSAKRKLKSLSGKENRWMTDVNHQLSKTLITRYGDHTLFVLEDLTGVTFNTDNLPKSLRNSNRSWSFYQLEQFLTYKSALTASQVVNVSAQYTSQRCPKCGVIRKANRDHSIHEYICENCGYHSNDDRIGAMNIQLLGTQYVSGIDKPRFTKNIITTA